MKYCKNISTEDSQSQMKPGQLTNLKLPLQITYHSFYEVSSLKGQQNIWMDYLSLISGVNIEAMKSSKTNVALNFRPLIKQYK